MSDVYRLAEPRKKGILHLIFSRLFIVVLLLALQVGMYVSLYGWLNKLLPFFSVLKKQPP